MRRAREPERMRALAALALVLAGIVPPAGASPPVVITPFHCGGHEGAIAAMENSYAVSMGGACWVHLGHHTYDAGALHEVGNVAGRVFSVEIQFSPPTEFLGARPQAPAVPPLPLPSAPVWTALAFEVSADGLAWQIVHEIGYRMSGGTRQEIFFEFDAGGVGARFLRIRQPRSAAQGLSGYLDHSQFVAELTPLAQPPPPPPNGVYTCDEHAFERFFAEHPCWFGGINRYDSPSVFHTYHVGDGGPLYAVHGMVVIAPWRSDDYFDNGGSPTEVGFLVEASVDGQHWTTVGTDRAPYGDRTLFAFDDLTGVSATYLRIVAEPHTGFDEHPALKHARGFLIDSGIAVSN